MNRKVKIKYFFKVATRMPITMRQKLLAGILGLGTLVGISDYDGSENLDANISTEQLDLKEDINEGNINSEINLIDYEIKPGDNIMNISLKMFPGHASRAKDFILNENKLDENSAKNLQVGQVIKIPSSRSAFVNHFKLEENHDLSASEYIKDFIKEKEGLHSKAVDVEKDGKNILTVGYGHRLFSNERFKDYKDELKKIKQNGRTDGNFTDSDLAVKRWFEDDILEAERKIKSESLPRLTQNQFDALVSFVYNTGGLPDIKNDLLSGDLRSASQKIRNHSSASVDGYGGLKKRRNEEANHFINK
jgi:GH24 family phage-related lysozyme (muramidase)